MNQIKAVIFDAGGVLVDWRTPFQIFLNQFGLELDSALQITKDIIVEAELGKISTDEFCRRVMGKLGHKTEWLNLRKIMPEKFIPLEPTFKLIKEIKRQYRLALLTNAEVGQIETMDKLWHFKQFFELIIDSSVVKLRKPQPQIFLLVCKRLALKPEECLFIDDGIDNIQAAEKLGFKTVHFNKPEESVKLIRKILYETV